MDEKGRNRITRKYSLYLTFGLKDIPNYYHKKKKKPKKKACLLYFIIGGSKHFNTYKKQL